MARLPGPPRWEVRCNPVGGSVNVYPGQAGAKMNGWPSGIRLREKWRHPTLWNNYRLAYPKTRAQVERSLAWCRVVVDRENAAEERARALVAEVCDGAS